MHKMHHSFSPKTDTNRVQKALYDYNAPFSKNCDYACMAARTPNNARFPWHLPGLNRDRKLAAESLRLTHHQPDSHRATSSRPAKAQNDAISQLGAFNSDFGN